MKTELQVDLSFNKILSIVKQLTTKEKILLSRELEKDMIDSKLSQLLELFQTNDLDDETLNNEIENVRQEIYEEQKGKSHF